MAALKKGDPIVIVGGGVFGLSTALHLLKKGYQNVTVLERAQEVPARDSAGYDLNKIVRSSYSDPFYTKLARSAIKRWKRSELQGCYHESGVFIPCTASNNPAYANRAYENDVASGAEVTAFRTEDEARKIFPSGIDIGIDFSANGGDATETDLKAYFNRHGGWAESGRSLDVLLAGVRSLGAQVLAGKEVTGAIRKSTGDKNGDGGKPKSPYAMQGVRCADGSGYEAAAVIVAAGAWTPRLMQRWGLESKAEKEKVEADVKAGMSRHVGVGLATGQTVATIQLTPEEAERYRSCPVVLDFGTGFYIFPPTADNVVKLAIHSNGYLHKPSESSASTPRTALTNGSDGLRIPKEAVQRLREGLKSVYPELAQKPFAGTRLCWYNDSVDEDWVIGYHPTIEGLLFATAGNGHAYKFLPNIGKLVVSALEKNMNPEAAARFAPYRTPNTHPSSRVGPPSRALDLTELCEQVDLSTLSLECV